jgi:methylmalonyl-CoA epimerase
VIRACRELGVNSVTVCSEVDNESLHIQYAEERSCTQNLFYSVLDKPFSVPAGVEVRMAVGIDHLGVAVNNLDEAISLYRDVFGLKLEGVHVVKGQKVRVASFSTGGETKIELLEPTESESPIAKSIEKRGEGVHHIALKVRNIKTTLEELKEKGLKLVDEKPRIGVGGARIAFIHPKSTRNVLLELCEKP